MTVGISGGREEKQDVVWDYEVTHNPSCTQMQTVNGGCDPALTESSKENRGAIRKACNEAAFNRDKKIPSI